MSTFQNSLPDLTAPPTGPAPGATVYVETYGCQMNVYDTQAIHGLLKRDGFAIVKEDTSADVVLLNTCSVRDLAEHKVISRVGELRAKGRETGRMPLVGICGCMAERLGKELRKGPNKVDLVVGVDNYDTLPGLLRDLTGHQTPPAATVTGHRPDTHYVAPPALYPTNNSHLVTIHKGCDYKCTYCIVPATRGPQSEKAPDTIMDEIRGIVEGGGREVTLLGQNVTAYKYGDDMDFAALVEKVAEVDGLERIRFLTGHPKDMHPHTMDTIGRLDKVCPWVHIPVQSGSDRVLRRMKRLYTRDEYMEMIRYARQVIPDVTFSSDIIVGFPGETEDDFQATLEVVREVKYDQLFSFKYSERPGVPAAKLDDDVSTEDKKRRLAELITLQEEIWQAEAVLHKGARWKAVVEGKARRPEGHWRLRTANNRKVVVPAPELQDGGIVQDDGFVQGSDIVRVGDLVDVTVTGHRNTTFLGELSA
jgi:tRNA-2-methylthio-N6-dimethylallyladenosine synthase